MSTSTSVAAIRFSLLGLAAAITPGTIIKAVTDSQLALYVLNALVPRSPALCADVRRLLVVGQWLRVTHVSYWVSTVANVLADTLRRTKDSPT